MMQRMFHFHCKDKAVSSNIRAKTRPNESEPKPVVATLSHLLVLELAFENNQRGDEKQKRMVKQCLKILSSFQEKKKELNSFITAKWRASRKKVSSWRLVKIPSKFTVVGLKMKMIRCLMKKRVRKQFENESVVDDNEKELCKKRILMGRRCKPLFSPSPRYLSYNKGRLLLPEIAS